jgi:hypothetical protein
MDGVREIRWEIHLDSQTLKITKLIIWFKFLKISIKSVLKQKIICIIFQSLVRKRRVAGFWWWERKSSFKPFQTTKMNFFGINKPDLISCFCTLFSVFWVDRLISECFKGVSEVFLSWNNLKIEFFEQKSSTLIFWAAQLWSKY